MTTSPPMNQHRKCNMPHWLPALAILISTTIASAGEIESFAEPFRTINVAAAEAGLLVTLHVDEGAVVKKGQPLGELNQETYKANLEIARVASTGTSAIVAAEAEVRLRENFLKKLMELRRNDKAHDEETNKAKLEFELASARLMLAREQNEVKKLEFDRAQTQLDQRTVKSPIEGVVTQIHKQAGEYLNAAEPVVLTIAQLDPLIVTFSVPVAQIHHLQSDQQVQLRIDGLKQPREADISLLSQVIIADSQTVRVKVKLANPNYELRSGAKCYLSLPDPPSQTKTTAKSPENSPVRMK